MSQAGRRQEFRAGPRPRNLFSVGVRHIRIFPVMHHQYWNAHTPGQRGNVQLFPTDLKPVLEIPAHRVVGPQRKTKMLCKGMREEDYIRGRCQEHSSLGSKAIAHRQRHRRPAQ